MNFFINHTILKNLVSLSLVKAIDYIIPLISLPILIRRIGIDSYGVWAFFLVIIGYIGILTDYGISLTGTRDVAVNKKDQEYITLLFNNIIYIKVGLCLLSYSLLCLVVFIYGGEYSFLYYCSIGIIVGQGILPLWFLQGMERMEFISLINGVGRIGYLFFIYFFVYRTDGIIYLVTYQSLSSFAIAIFTIVFIMKKWKICLRAPKAKMLFIYLIDGFDLFLSRFFGLFYKSSPVIILGFFCSPTIVGFFSISDRVIRTIQTVQGIAGDSIFPYFNAVSSQNNLKYFILHRRFIKWVLVISLILCMIVFYSAKIILLALTGEASFESILAIKIMSFIIFFGAGSYYLGVLGLVVSGYKRDFSIATFYAAIITVFLSGVLIYFYGLIGASFGSLLGEFILFFLVSVKYMTMNKGSCFD